MSAHGSPACWPRTCASGRARRSSCGWSIFPVIATLLVQLVFGTLLAPKPRLGIVDLGASEITAVVQQLEGIEYRAVASADELKRMVRDHDLDAGLVLPAGFDEQVRAGERPLLELYISGESLASDRLIIAVTTIDLVRQVEGAPAPVDVQVVALGEALLPISARLVPLLVLFALLLAGIFLTAFSIVQEREKRTLDALLVTPMGMNEVLAAKGILGFTLGRADGAGHAVAQRRAGDRSAGPRPGAGGRRADVHRSA
jgi:ABC-2 type transport system permease protein